MKIGKYKLKIVESGYFGLDGGAMFGIIPKPLWQKTNSADESNRVKLATRNLLLESEDRKILVDVGMGDKWNDKEKMIYDVDNNTSMEKGLGTYGLKAGDITDVILTHLHFDHCGGSTKVDKGKLVPAFPNARYFVQKQNYDWAVQSSDRDKGSYIKSNFVPLFEAGVLSFTIGDACLDDEIDFMVINGHTFGQQMLKISDSANTLVYCCDLFPFVSHIPIPYIMGYDLQPLVTMKEKANFLQQAADENWLLFFGHDPEIAFATVKHTDKGIRVDKTFRNFEKA